jgi:hypothetical protein
MKISSSTFISAISLSLSLWPLSLTLAQDDRGERIQESVTSSDDRIDFSKRKAAPSKIESVFYQDLMQRRKDCKSARKELAEAKRQAKRHADKETHQAIERAQERVKKAEAAVKQAQRKANAD